MTELISIVDAVERFDVSDRTIRRRLKTDPSVGKQTNNGSWLIPTDWLETTFGKRRGIDSDIDNIGAVIDTDLDNITATTPPSEPTVIASKQSVAEPVIDTVIDSQLSVSYDTVDKLKDEIRDLHVEIGEKRAENAYGFAAKDQEIGYAKAAEDLAQARYKQASSDLEQRNAELSRLKVDLATVEAAKLAAERDSVLKAGELADTVIASESNLEALRLELKQSRDQERRKYRRRRLKAARKAAKAGE
jgi:hypothetical protein